MQEFKIKIHNPEHSKAVQERLFELGYEWAENKKNVSYLSSAYITTYGIGNMLHGNALTNFQDSNKKQVTLDDLY